MKKLLAAALLAALAGAPAAFAIEPIPGSITYNGQPHTRLTKAPIGSQVQHQFYYNGYDYRETYLIQPDRSLKLVNRYIVQVPGNR
jgi:opacity protein-like surface antigen